MKIQYKFTQNFGNFRDDLDKAVFEKGLEHEQSYGPPKLPSTACRGPNPRRQEFSDSGGDNYGPKLPSKPCFGPQNTRKTELDFAAKEIKSLENLWTIVALVLVIFSFLIMFICLFSQVRSQS